MTRARQRRILTQRARYDDHCTALNASSGRFQWDRITRYDRCDDRLRPWHAPHRLVRYVPGRLVTFSVR